MESPKQSDFIREMQRLHAAQVAANATKDPEAIAQAAHDLTVFLRYSGAGRLGEYWARIAPRRAQKGS